AGKHPRVVGGHSHRVSGVAHLGDGLDVVPVPVGLDDPAYAERGGEVEQHVVLVGGVDEHGVTTVTAAQDEDVVVHRSDDDLVALHVGVGDVEGSGAVGHGWSLAPVPP